MERRIHTAASLSGLPGGPALFWLPTSLRLYKQGATGWAIVTSRAELESGTPRRTALAQD
jgi:hypothetical protein